MLFLSTYFVILFSDQEKECPERLCGDRRTTGSDTLHDLQQDSQQSEHGGMGLHSKSASISFFPCTITELKTSFLLFQRLARLPKGPMLHFKVSKVNKRTQVPQ